MHRALLIGIFVALADQALAADPQYPQEVSQWQEVKVPSGPSNADRIVWSYAANYSAYEWRVFSENGQIHAQLASENPPTQREHPNFSPKAGEFSGAALYARTDDGWLVGFNQGEFGAALYWFSPDGQRNYKVSDHQVVDFFSLPDGLYAIEGLAHLSMSEGAVVRIARPSPKDPWHATTLAKLPFAPYTISVARDGTMLIALSDSLVSVGHDGKITTLLNDSPWDGLYPNSSVLSADGQKLYIGMRQFVGEFEIAQKKIRLLVPSDRFLNKLPKETEQQIRQQYGSER